MYTAHPAAELFPLLEGPEFDELVESIRQHGLLEKIELDDKGRILDGRNRYRACEQAGIEPQAFRKHLFDTNGNAIGAYEYVIAKNLHRRQLTADQRAQIAVEALPHLAEEAAAHKAEAARAQQTKDGRFSQVATDESESRLNGEHDRNAGKTTTKLADMTDVSRYKIEQAARIAKASPELAAKVKAGKVTARDAERQLPKPAPAPPAKPADPWKQYRKLGELLLKIDIPQFLDFAEDTGEVQEFLVHLFDTAQKRGIVL